MIGSMTTHSYTSRRELEEHSFHPVVAVLVPVLAIVLQAMLPRIFPRLTILDLPLLVAIFFAVSRRSPITGALTGAVIGLLQDALTGQPIGVNGISKTVIGYIGASIGLKVDVDAATTRVVMNFAFSLLNSALLFFIARHLLGLSSEQFLWSRELLRALLETAVALPLFFFLDRAKRPI